MKLNDAKTLVVGLSTSQVSYTYLDDDITSHTLLQVYAQAPVGHMQLFVHHLIHFLLTCAVNTNRLLSSRMVLLTYLTLSSHHVLK